MKLDRNLFVAILLLLIQIAMFPVVRAYGLYNRFWFADVILHVEAGAMFGLFWFWLTRKSNVSRLLKYSTAITFAVFGSFLWEVWEFAGWRLLPNNTPNYIPALGDSLSDIACGLLGAILISLIHYAYKKSNK